MEHDARFWSGRGGVLIAVVSNVCSDFSMCQKDFSQFWQMELGFPPVQQFIWPKRFQLSSLRYLATLGQCDETL